MKSLLVIKIFCLALTAPLLAKAGNWSSSGGNAVACLSQRGAVLSAQLLDLYEGSVLQSLKYPDFNGKIYQEIAEEIADKLDQSMETDGFLKKKVIEIYSGFKLLPSDSELKLVDDSNHIVEPSDCGIYQLANYRSNGDMFVDSTLWQALDEVNKAALIVHEALYFYLRLYGESTSERTRRAVANVFADTPMKPVSYIGSPYPISQIETCTTQTSDYDLPFASLVTYPDNNGNVVFQFLILDRKRMISQSTLKGVALDWPISSHPKDVAVFSYLDSVVDGGEGYYITFNPNAGEKIQGHISKFKNISTLELIPFSCEVEDYPTQ